MHPQTKDIEMTCSCSDRKSAAALAADTIRILSIDAVQKAKSGHPGTPMGAADFAFTLFSKFLRFDPARPDWIGRDRFVLSAGHGSILLYSLLHLFGYDVSLDDLKNFRQFGSRTPGHPEYGRTPGVEVTTGPLGSGLCSAVGMAMAIKQFNARVGMPEALVKDQRVYVFSGDGCIMEGCSHEACALAASLRLDNLILYYDSNKITIEGATDVAMNEDVAARFAAYGWNVLKVNGQCPAQIEAALTLAKSCHDRPSIVIGQTTIGYGAPHLAGSAKTHGAPLGPEEVAATKAALGFDPGQSFVVPQEVRDLCAEIIGQKQIAAAQWDDDFAAWKAAAPAEKVALMESLLHPVIPADLGQSLLAAIPDKDVATRASSGAMLQVLAARIPALTGGSADLGPSNNTNMKGFGDFSASDRTGRNLHFGVRELAMGLAANGMALTNTIPFTATFLVFSDYMKPAIRLAAIQKLHEVYVFTHDSYAVGEDGATHEPVEHLMMFRTMPGVVLLRPAESHEVAQAWEYAVRAACPVVLALTRQAVPNFPATMVPGVAVSRGAYVLSDDEGYEAIIIATGSEVGLALAAADRLRVQGRRLRVVSMPSWELFDAQDEHYRQSVLPDKATRRISVEAGIATGWQKYIGRDGLALGLNHFGDSAPASRLAEEYGFTPEKVASAIADYLR